MARISYDHWPELIGSRLFVTVGSRLFFGEFMGLSSPPSLMAVGRQPESAWALKTDHGLVYFDPDNGAVVVHPCAYRSKASRDTARCIGSARILGVIEDAETFIRSAELILARADLLIEKHKAHTGIAVE